MPLNKVPDINSQDVQTPVSNKKVCSLKSAATRFIVEMVIVKIYELKHKNPHLRHFYRGCQGLVVEL